MIVVDIYGKIDETIVSSRLCITILNLPGDWQESLVEIMEQELYGHAYVVKKYKDSKIEQYDLRKIHKLHFINHFTFKDGSSEKEVLRKFAEHMIGMQTMGKEESMLCLKNEYIDSPTCEKEFCEKLLDFLKFILHHKNKDGPKLELNIPAWIYSSERSILEETRLFSYLNFNPSKYPLYRRKFINDTQKIADLICLGNMVDNCLQTENDFWKLDYLINSVFEDNNYNTYHFFRNINLLELLLVRPNKHGNIIELDTKLISFLPAWITADKYEGLSMLLRQIRNKIGHGDFISVNKKCEEYADLYMKNFNFDYFELSRQNWIMSNLCCLTDNILANVLWLMLTDKQKLIDLQISS